MQDSTEMQVVEIGRFPKKHEKMSGSDQPAFFRESMQAGMFYFPFFFWHGLGCGPAQPPFPFGKEQMQLYQI